MPRTLLLSVLTALVLADRSPEELVYAPAEGLELTRSFSADGSYSLDEMRIEADGEEIPHGEAPELSIDSKERIVVTDELQEVEDGRPLRLRRTFDELGRSVVYSSPEQDEDVERESTCDLEGSSVILRWDPDEEAYVAEADEGESIDEDVLADLIEDMDLRQLLPDHEVEPGDEWQVPVDAYARLMWPGGFLRFHEEDEEYDEAEAASDREMVENLEGSGKVVFEELRTEDGVSVAVLKVSFEVDSRATRSIEGRGGREAERTVTIHRELEGTVYWDVEAGHLRSGQLEADAEIEEATVGTMVNREGDEFELSQTNVFSGSISYTIEIEERG